MSMSCSQQKTAQEYYDLGKAAVVNDQFDIARLEFKNALSQDTSFHAARFDLGLSYYSAGDFASAQFYFESAEERGFDEPQLTLLMASTYLKQNDLSSLQTLLNKQKDQTPTTENRIPLALYHILLLARTEQLERAESRYNELIEAEPSAVQQCAPCLFSQAQLESYRSPTDAISTLNTLVDLYSDYPHAYLLRGQLHFALRNANQALDDFMLFESLQPENVYIKFLIAVTALQLKDISTANTYTDQLLVANPKQPFLNHLHALLAFAREDYTTANDSAGKAKLYGLQTPANEMVAGVSAYQLGNYEAAYRHLNKAKLYYPDNIQLRRLLTLIEFRFGNLQAAGQGFVKTDIKGIKDALFGNLIAYQLVKNEQFEAAKDVVAFVQTHSVYQPIVNLQSKLLDNQISLENSLSLKQVQPTSADRELSSDENLIRIIILIETQAIEQAKTEAQKWLDTDPENIDAINILAHAYDLLLNPVKANDLFDQALVLKPANTPSLLFKAKLAEQNDTPQLAHQLYNKVLDSEPQNLGALRGLLKLTFLAQQAPNWNELLMPLDGEILADDHVVAVVDAMFRWQAYETAATYLFEHQSQEQWSELIWMIWLKNSYYAEGSEKFLGNFNDYLQQSEQLGYILFGLSILESHKQFELLKNAIQLVPESQRKTDPVQLQLALAMVELKRFDEAAAIMSSIDDASKNESAQWYINGLVKQYQGDSIQAASYFSAYYESVANFHSLNSLMKVLIQAERIDEAVLIAKNFVKDNPTEAQARLFVALQLARFEPSVALELLESKSVTWFLLRNWKLSYNVAWLYVSQNNPAKGLIYAENALLLNPENDQVKALIENISSRIGR